MNDMNPAASISDAQTVSHKRPAVKIQLQTFASLFKLRIVMLLLITAIGGAILGAGGWPGGGNLALLIFGGGLSAAGASALNQYLERDRDAKMVRTRRRALAAGIIQKPIWVFFTGLGMILAAVGFSVIFNPILALSNALGAIIYIGVYTIWLKPRTILNIIIGGTAGSMAVISGGAAADAWNEPGVIALSLLIFAWTPTHFWSLALAYRKDYAEAGFPMLPVHVKTSQAARWVALHTVTTGLIAILLGFHPSLGLGYILPVSLVTYRFLQLTRQLNRDPRGTKALDLFRFSNIYLGVVLLIVIILPVVR